MSAKNAHRTNIFTVLQYLRELFWGGQRTSHYKVQAWRMHGVSTSFAAIRSKLRIDLGRQPPEVTTKFGAYNSLGCCTGAEGHAYPLAAGSAFLEDRALTLTGLSIARK